ncbi:hypothetical protein ACP90_27320 (plasmid) [Labrenzia sp. CP4]|nr:hypothetical protein ACP90_27320 [Labrenzia sp. CP4]
MSLIGRERMMPPYFPLRVSKSPTFAKLDVVSFTVDRFGVENLTEFGRQNPAFFVLLSVEVEEEPDGQVRMA